MRVSLDWLREFVDITESSTILGDMLSMLGMEAEETVNYHSLKDIIVGEVQSKDKHPNADKLSLCHVNNGKEILSVVCGAPNVKAGQKIAFAPMGSVLPGGFKISKAKIRGETSLGMICSESELGLSENHDGIMILDEDIIPGYFFADYLKERQAVLELDITPNRPDCFSHAGVARDIAAKTQRKYNQVVSQPRPLKENSIQKRIDVRIEDPVGCPRYVAGIVENVHVGPSPEWLVKRLESIGQRPINNIVDISNYVLYHMGHPTHMFDLDKIGSKEVIIRRAKKGESITTLDEVKRNIHQDHLLITNGPKPIAIAGIMGGVETAVSNNTTSVLIESAYFDPPTIRRGAKSLGMSTDASKRFERGADPEGAVTAFWLVVDLLEEIAGGSWLPGILDVYPKPIIQKPIRLTRPKIDLLSGCEISDEFINTTLSNLNIKVIQDGEGVWSCLPPSFRPDLEREVDLIEEVIRIYGYENVPVSQSYTGLMDSHDKDPQSGISSILQILSGLGFSQCFNNSLQSENIVSQGKINPVHVVNPLTEDMTHLRTSLYPGLLQTIDYNIKNAHPNLKLCEWGNVFEQSSPGIKGIDEKLVLSGLIHGEYDENSVHGLQCREEDYFSIKGIVSRLLQILRFSKIRFKNTDKLNHYYKNGFYIIDEDEIILGNYGEIEFEYMDSIGLEPRSVYAFELRLNPLLEKICDQYRYKSINPFPTVNRDLNFVLDEDVKAEDLLEKIKKNGRDILKTVKPVNIFRDKSLGKNKKSISINLVFQHPSKTLEDKDVNPVIDEIVRIVSKQFNAKLR